MGETGENLEVAAPEEQPSNNNKKPMFQSVKPPASAKPPEQPPNQPTDTPIEIPNPLEISEKDGKCFSKLYEMYGKGQLCGTLKFSNFDYSDFSHTPLELLNIIDMGYQKFIPEKDMKFSFVKPSGIGTKKEDPKSKVGTSAGAGSTLTGFGKNTALGQAKDVKIEFKPGTVTFPRNGLNHVETSFKYFIPSAHVLQTNQQVLGLNESAKPSEPEAPIKDYSSVFEPKLPELSAPADVAPLAPITIGRKNLLGNNRELFDHGEVKYEYKKAHNNIHISRTGIGSIDLILSDDVARNLDLDLSGVVMDPCSFDLGGIAESALVTMYGAWPADATGVRARSSGVIAEEYEKTLIVFTRQLGAFISYCEDTGALTFMVVGKRSGRITLPEEPVAF